MPKMKSIPKGKRTVARVLVGMKNKGSRVRPASTRETPMVWTIHFGDTKVSIRNAYGLSEMWAAQILLRMKRTGTCHLCPVSLRTTPLVRRIYLGDEQVEVCNACGLREKRKRGEVSFRAPLQVATEEQKSKEPNTGRHPSSS